MLSSRNKEYLSLPPLQLLPPLLLNSSPAGKSNQPLSDSLGPTLLLLVISLLLVTYGAWSKKPVLPQPQPPHFYVICLRAECYKTPPTAQMLPTPPTLPTQLPLQLLTKPLMLGPPRENKLLLNGPLIGTKVELLLPPSLEVLPLCSHLDSLKATPTNGDVKPLLSTQSEPTLFINPLGSSVQSLYQ